MKKKWIAILGSPRRGKNTDTIVDYVTESLHQKDIEVEKYYLDSTGVSMCTGCEACFDSGKCIYDDKISKIIECMDSVDGYILASPVYNYSISSQMKAFLDRTFCLNDYNGGWSSRLSGGKKAIVIATCRGNRDDSLGDALKCMERVISDFDVEIISSIGYRDTKFKPVKGNEKIKSTINQIIVDSDI